MKIGLVAPWKPDENWRGTRSYFNLPPLGLLQIAAATPRDVEIQLVDESWGVCPVDTSWDAAALSVMTPSAPRAYELADTFRARGVPVILGGSHVTALPEEAAAHADALVLGEGEGIWPIVLEDLRRGELEPTYRMDRLLDPAEIPPPRWSLIQRGNYRIGSTIMASRGCPYDCAFCSSTVFWGHRYRFRPVAEVLQEARSLPGRFMVFLDDNLLAREDYAVELLRGLASLGKRWVAQTTLASLADRPGLPRLAVKAGCLGVLVGFETMSPGNLDDVGKGINDPQRYREQIEVLHRHGILVQGSFVIGLDGDTPESLQALPDMIQTAGIDVSGYCILTPLPGTRIYDRLEGEGRLPVRDWARYNRHDVVFQPRHMSRRRLKEIQLDLYRRTFSWGSIWRRATWRWPHAGMYWPYNAMYRRGFQQMERRFHRDRRNGLYDEVAPEG